MNAFPKQQAETTNVIVGNSTLLSEADKIYYFKSRFSLILTFISFLVEYKISDILISLYGKTGQFKSNGMSVLLL